jgi:uncharacterized NAD(P)/FAD-binding protein YdhS
MSPGRPRVIVIIGAGFSGTVLSTHLLRLLPPVPTRIVLVERDATGGGGVAYGSHSAAYLLNVPAGRMSAFTDDSAHLVRFAQRHLPAADAETYLPRGLYGEYLSEVLGSARASAAAGVGLEQLRGEASSIYSVDAEGPVIVSVGTRQLLADQVVLACGDPAGASRSYAKDLGTHPAYILHPYQQPVFQPSDRAALLIGSGLTMADVAAVASTQYPALRIVAISRHGLLPRRQAAVTTPLLPATLQLGPRLIGQPLRVMVHSVRQLIASVEEQGGDWREVIGRVREVVPQIWQRLSVADRRRFLRHVRIHWDVHRHRMPPATADRMQELLQSGLLTLRAGSVVQLCADGERIVALWRPRGRYELQELWVDRVVECSGADQRLPRTTEKLWQQLLGDGVVTPDPNGVGIHTGAHGALIDVHGRASTRLFYLGPMLRAAHWEATAVGELRVHARELAAALAGADRHPRARTRALEHMYMPAATGQFT